MNGKHLQARFFAFAVGAALLLCGAAASVSAAPGDVIFAEYFDDDTDFNDDWFAAGSGKHSVNTMTFRSPPKALALSEGDIYVKTKSGRINAAVPAAELSVWVRRGHDDFSENPDPNQNEHLQLQYFSRAGNWEVLRRWDGGGTPGQIYRETIPLPDDALRAGVDIRFAFPNGGGAGLDYWHIDDVVVTETAATVETGGSVCRQLYNNEFSSAADFTNDWTATGSGSHEVNNRTFHSAPESLSLWGGDVSVTSNAGLMDANVAEAHVAVWVRRGHDDFSENPDANQNEDLFLEYRNNSGAWQSLAEWTSSGDPGEIMPRTVSLPGDGLHANLQLRFRFPTGGGGNLDYWHIDDVVVNQTGFCTTSLDHFDVLAASTAATCEAHPINIQAMLAGGSVDTAYAGTINLSTSTGRGDWVKAQGQGVLVNGDPDSGIATYTFSAQDNGGALANGTLLALKNVVEETVNINVTDGSATERSNNALPSDPDIKFANSLLSFGPVGDQIAGNYSNVPPLLQTLTLEAISTNPTTGRCERRLPAGDHTLEVAAECINPDSCAMPDAMQVNGVTVSVNAHGDVDSYNYTAVRFDFDANGSSSYSLIYADAGQVALHARITLADNDSGPALTLQGNTEPFVVRPFGFYIDVADNPAASDANGAVFKKAGESFAMTLRAVAWQQADDKNNDGAPDITDDNSNTNSNSNAALADNPTTENFGNEATPAAATVINELFLPAGGINPDLSNNAFANFTNGTSTNEVSWDEVGILQLRAALSDAQYLSFTDSVDVNGNVDSALALVGRFTPDHFTIKNHTLTHRSDLSCLIPGFTYMGEPAELTVRLQARNMAKAVTENYIGDFAKLNSWTSDLLSDEIHVAVVDAVANTNLTPRFAVSDGASYDWNSERGELSANFVINRAAVPDGSLLTAFAINPIDDDGVGLLTESLDIDVDGDSSEDHARLTDVDNSEQFRFGRIRINNAFGPETRELPVTMSAEYFEAGEGWKIADDDSCTQLLNSELMVDGGGDFDATVGGGTSTAVPGYVVPGGFVFNNGDARLKFTAPGSGNVGEFDLGASLANYPWLQFDWNGDDSYNNDPVGVITFGQYRGNDHIIYWREVH